VVRFEAIESELSAPKKKEQKPSELLWLTSRLEPNGKVFPIHPLTFPHGVLVAIGSI
jgi:hypothetical protein